MSLRDKILGDCGEQSRRKTTFEHPKWGTVHLQSLTEAERMEIEFSKLDENGNVSAAEAGKSTARMAIRMVIDQNGNRQFDDKDLDMLVTMDTAVAGPLRDAMNKHAKLVEETDVDEAKKN